MKCVSIYSIARYVAAKVVGSKDVCNKSEVGSGNNYFGVCVGIVFPL